MAQSHTGKTRFRTVHRGIWPFRWTYLVLQVEINDRTEIRPERHGRSVEVYNNLFWRDAKLQDLSVGTARELFVRENPR